MARRLLLALIGLGWLAGVAVLALRPRLIERHGQATLAALAERLGLEISAEAVLPLGWTGARIERLRVGPAEAPLLTLRRAQARLSWAQVLRGPRRPTEIEASGAVLHVNGDGSLEGAVRALRAALPEERPGASGEAGGGSGSKLPQVILTDFELIDHAGALRGVGGELRLVNGRVEGSLELLRPALGRCRLGGDREGIAVDCEAPMSLPLPAGLRVEGQALELERAPIPKLRLKGVRVAAGAAGGRLARILGGLGADLTVTLTPDRAGRYPVVAALRLPGGGAIAIDGLVDRGGAVMGAEVEDLRLDPVHGAVDGWLSGQLRLRVDRASGQAMIEGRARLRQVTVTHAALAGSPVGPFDLAVEGKLEASAPPGGRMEAGRIALTGGKLRVGEVALTLEASVDNTQAAPVVAARVTVPTVPAERVAEAIPQGLMPHLQPLAAKGQFGFDGELKIDWAKLPETVLQAKLNLRGLKLTQVNPEVDLARLRDRFTTRFVLPDETVHERETGPNSPRWVALDALPALLPQAVIAQEDGGFYRHGGVSLFHLRGSLIRNLEQGRFARGGSTLSMQLARNLFLHRHKTLARKLEELVLTWLIEAEFSKDELMELYLNVVEFGEGIYGILDASSHYFDKPPYALDPVEIAFLVRLLPAPRRFGKQKEKGKLEGWYAKRIARQLDLLVERGHLEARLRDAARPEALFRGPTMDPEVWRAPVGPPSAVGADGLDEAVPLGADELPDPFAPATPPGLELGADGERLAEPEPGDEDLP